MKRLLSLLIVFCIVLFYGTAIGQNTEKDKSSQRGGFSVGGYDQTRKSKASKKAVNIPEETEKAEKSIEAEKSNQDIEKAMAPAPAPAMEAKEAPASAQPKGKVKGKLKQKNDSIPSVKQK